MTTIDRQTLYYSGMEYSKEELDILELVIKQLDDNVYDGLLHKLVHHIEYLTNSMEELEFKYNAIWKS